MNVKPILKAALVIASAFAVTGCIETTAPLCDATNKVDVPGFDREHTLALFLDPAGEMQELSFTYARVAKGEYEIVAASDLSLTKSTISTCQLGSWTISESKTEHGTYSQSIVSMSDAGVMTMNQMVLSPSTLSDAGIDFEIIERELEEQPNAIRRMIMEESGKAVQKVLVIKNNSRLAYDVIEKNARPNAFGFSTY